MASSALCVYVFAGLVCALCVQDAERIAKEGLAFETTLGPDAWLDHGMAHALYFQGWEAKFLCDESANNMQNTR
jgi:hypothetical protein